MSLILMRNRLVKQLQSSNGASIMLGPLNVFIQQSSLIGSHTFTA